MGADEYEMTADAYEESISLSKEKLSCMEMICKFIEYVERILYDNPMISEKDSKEMAIIKIEYATRAYLEILKLMAVRELGRSTFLDNDLRGLVKKLREFEQKNVQPGKKNVRR